jgi:hypothetical protein
MRFWLILGAPIPHEKPKPGGLSTSMRVKKTDSETQMLFEFITHRYESGSYRRIIHHATIVEIDSGSYRRKNQKKL